MSLKTSSLASPISQRKNLSFPEVKSVLGFLWPASTNQWQSWDFVLNPLRHDPGLLTSYNTLQATVTNNQSKSVIR
jgi:hypothetical protein